MGHERVVLGTINTPVGRYGATLSPRGLCRLTSPSEPVALCQAWVDRWMPGAVGAANGANPVAVIVPCHRVIGSNGELRGYAGGLSLKHTLLEHEGAGPGTRAATGALA